MAGVGMRVKNTTRRGSKATVGVKPSADVERCPICASRRTRTTFDKEYVKTRNLAHAASVCGIPYTAARAHVSCCIQSASTPLNVKAIEEAVKAELISDLLHYRHVIMAALAKPGLTARDLAAVLSAAHKNVETIGKAVQHQGFIPVAAAPTQVGVGINVSYPVLSAQAMADQLAAAPLVDLPPSVGVIPRTWLKESHMEMPQSPATTLPLPQGDEAEIEN